jgi:hypothetical protein
MSTARPFQRSVADRLSGAFTLPRKLARDFKRERLCERNLAVLVVNGRHTGWWLRCGGSLVSCGHPLKPRPPFLNLELVELLPSFPFSLELFLDEPLANLV